MFSVVCTVQNGPKVDYFTAFRPVIPNSAESGLPFCHALIRKVRGTTRRKIVRMMRAAGTREVHLRIPLSAHRVALFLRSGHALEGRFVEADSVGYHSLASLRKAVDDDQRHEYWLRLLYRRLSHRSGQHRRADGQPAWQTLTMQSALRATGPRQEC
jgi:hypothetical protein